MQQGKSSSVVIQNELRNSLSVGSQCEFSTVSRGVQCSLENSSKSCGTQCEILQYTSRGTQWCLEDVHYESSSRVSEVYGCPGDEVDTLQLCDVPTCSSSIVENLSTNSTSEQCSLQRKKVSTSPLVQSLSAAESQILGKNIASRVVQSCGLGLPGRKNTSDEVPLSLKSVKKHRKDNCASSSTSGVAEMSGVESMESPLSIELPKKIMKQKKRLWTPSHDVTSVCEESEVNFSHSISKAKNCIYPHKDNRNNVRSVRPKLRYSYEEEIAIIDYISKNKLHCRVGGVSMWQDMEAKVGIDRTWQSLKEHFRKKILPNIDKFKLPSKQEELFCKITMR